MELEVFYKMRLVGGTSLALQLGHRNSVDIDLFGIIEDEIQEINEILSKIGNLNILKKSKNINIYSIDNIKVDIVNYPYPWLEDVIENNGIRMAGQKDIAAMKLAAISGRGTKKDFIDLFFLLKRYSLEEMLYFYSRKYNDGTEAIVLKSLSYFHDANEDIEPVMYKKIIWENVKAKIRKEVKSFVQEGKKI